MREIGRTYRDWILAQQAGGVAASALDDDRIRFVLPTATAEVNFYPYGDTEIVELRVVRTSDGESTFFLHFELADDLAHAEELFGQLSAALDAEGEDDVVHVLLSCTSAFTTTMFAAKMNEVAKTLKLGYDFEAMSLDRALSTDKEYAAIMLAPQAAYMRKQMAEAHPTAIVFEIPGKVFGAYDAAAAIGLLMHALREVETPDDSAAPLSAVRDLSDDRRVLVITLFALMDQSRLGWRLYDHGEPGPEGVIRYKGMDFGVIGDLVQSLLLTEIDPSSLDAIGIAVPGVACRGAVHLPDYGVDFFDLGMTLTERFRVPVYVDNNCNAAAVGCYVRQDEVENLVFYRQAFGHPTGGLGTVIDGRILKGHLNFAGEPRYFAPFFDHKGLDFEDLRWTAEGLQQTARYVSLAAISLISPDALYLSVDTLDDADAFADSLAEVVGEGFVPRIHLVGDYVEHVYLGTLAMALQKLRDPKYRSHGVGQVPEAFRRERWEQEWERIHRR